MRKLQIGVMGSVSDLKYGKEIERIAEQVGALIAKNGAILLFGAEKDFDSLSAAACRGAKRKGGLTVGVTYNKGKNIFQNDADIIICSGMERGGGRELVLTLSCDAIVAISGGSGTLTEIAIAYQADIPIVVLAGTGGWAEALAGTYLDARERRKVLVADNPENAVDIALQEAAKYLKKTAQ